MSDLYESGRYVWDPQRLSAPRPAGTCPVCGERATPDLPSSAAWDYSGNAERGWLCPNEHRFFEVARHDPAAVRVVEASDNTDATHDDGQIKHGTFFPE